MRLSVSRLFLALLILWAMPCAAETPPLPFVEGSWTLVVLPDTQNYCSSHPEVFTSQTKWIVEHVKKRNIPFVLHEGDVTNHNAPEEWERAKTSMSLLDGVVPYAIAPGNHDYNNRNQTRRESKLSEYFPVELYRKQPTFGGVYERGNTENSYHLFSAGGRDWVMIALEFGPRDSVLRWADKILRAYPDRSAIIVMHAYLFFDDTRYDHTNPEEKAWNPHKYPMANLPGGVNDGEEIWRKLASQHANVAFVLCGHVLGDGAGRLTSMGVHENSVHQILANYQFRAKGGEGYLRLLEFLPDENTVQVKTYSPYLDKYMTDEQQQFTLHLPPAPTSRK